jgi:hypothetical protein
MNIQLAKFRHQDHEIFHHNPVAVHRRIVGGLSVRIYAPGRIIEKFFHLQKSPKSSIFQMCVSIEEFHCHETNHLQM